MWAVVRTTSDADEIVDLVHDKDVAIDTAELLNGSVEGVRYEIRRVVVSFVKESD